MNIFSRQIWQTTGVVLIAGMMASCGTSNTTYQENSSSSLTSPTTGKTPSVVVTTTVICDLAKRIAQDSINLTCLLKPGIDAHLYQPLPEDRRAIENASLILYSGYGLEPELIKLIKAASNPAPKVAVAEEAVPKPLLGEEHHHQQAQGEQLPDPHVWHNAENGVQMVEVIESHLETLQPAKAALYHQNAEKLKTELIKIHNWIKTQIATIPPNNRQLITTHDALGYYGNAYGIPVAGALQGLSTDEKPTAARVKELVDEVKASHVPTIFAEVVVNPKLIQAVARDARVKIAQQELYSDSLGEPGSSGDSYPKMLISNTQTILEGLGGKYVAFPAQ
ncbi:metal ABC transporter solute-binding protein, Zn/Mn family [Gloeothece verrucosa]|uniref:Periplasmic solute binding protein n=1 Tax=Gloeothece verrucosa (strain PCC 7822) TaxID=497965 RepID=E0UC63_GLOV7|nr:zinc ABC transporter substrate-binding protein [Gloeothece verrucosa]ADN16401.1 periplasmic solute binding protein [Gloeothece verrucosa PCC 7822]